MWPCGWELLGLPHTILKSKVQVKVRIPGIAVRGSHHTATGNGITQCYLPHGIGDFPVFILAEAGTRFSNERCNAELTWWWLYPKMVYPPMTVTYLRNNQAVSWLGFDLATDVVTTDRAIREVSKMCWQWCQWRKITKIAGLVETEIYKNEFRLQMFIAYEFPDSTAQVWLNPT